MDPKVSRLTFEKTLPLEKFHFKNTTIMLAPASGFYSMDHSINNQVRIAYVLEVEKLKLAIKILQKGIEEYNN